MLDHALIEPLAAAGPIVVALSGGGDSTALLHLLAERLGSARLRAIVIDHKLRASSDEDARRAQGFAHSLGIAAEIVALAWSDGAKRGQQQVRQQRYRALCAAARRLGARIIAVAHNADDQAETLLMRAAAGSNWRGLAGIAPLAPAPVWPEGRGIMLARPLLSVRRKELRATLRARGADWIEDPANLNPTFARVRTRARLAALVGAGFNPARLTQLARKLRVLADQLDVEAAALTARAANFEGERIVIDRAQWAGDVEVRRRAMSVLLAAASGAGREAEAPALARLEALFCQTDFCGACLGGAQLSRSGADVVISRDLGALRGRADGARPAPALLLNAGIETVWDGRLCLLAPEPGWSVVVEQGILQLAKGQTRLALGEAGAVVSGDWLLQAHVRHSLNLG